MNTLYTHRYVLRATVEFTTPFLIGAGREGDFSDAIFVADANGLPAIPGSSLAGVLRSAFRDHVKDTERENRLFGFQNGAEGSGSRLLVSWGCIHDSRGVPVEGILPPESQNDEVLAKAMSPALRDHVRIHHRGASDAEERGKFDEQAVCAGHRFTFELELLGTQEDQPLWDQLQEVLSDPALRLGGKTRRGYGAFTIVSRKTRVFDLRSDFEAYRSHPVSLAQPSNVLQDVPAPSQASSVTHTVQICLQPSGYWMFGGGYDTAADKGDADMAPIRDCRIEWEGGKGKVREDLLVIPASGIKGALSHRVAFHYNALTGVFADTADTLSSSTGECNLAVRELFGFCKGREDAVEEDGQRGRVILDDLYLTPEKPPVSQLIHHVGIDRFTGGARDQVLFSERPLWKGELPTLKIRVVEAEKIQDPRVLTALRKALEDLAEGRLQIGAGSGRGLGRFQGRVEWPEAMGQ